MAQHVSFREKKELSDEGFFKNYYTDLRNAVNEDLLREFETLKTDQERVVFASEICSIKRLKVDWLEGGKNLEEAKRLKEEGNKAFVKNKNEEALTFYTASLLVMPHDACDMAILLANRSASLYHIQKYESAINDIDFALDLDYPKHMKYKILERKAKCLLALNDNAGAVKQFKETLRALDDSKLMTERKMKLQTDIQIMLGIMTKRGQPNEFPAGAFRGQPREADPELCSKKHKIYLSSCDKLDIVEEPCLGRCAVAVSDIAPGEVLVVEKPDSAILLMEYAQTHCQHCLKRAAAPYPCRNCSKVVFCSRACKNSAEATYHKYECPILATIYSSGVSVTVLMALRIITQRPLEFFLRAKESICVAKKKFEKYESSDYEAVYHLVRHENLRKKEDFFERTVMALFLLECLRKGNYFSQRSEDSEEGLAGEEQFICGLMLRHLQILQFNAHEIFEVVQAQGQKLDQSRTVFIGGGIFPTLSLFNHSCDPGVIRYFRGSTVVVRAIKTIRKGQFVYENYGPLFTSTEREHRRAKLRSQYWFECCCVPCSENWPTLGEMDDSTLRFRCNSMRSDDNGKSSCSNVIPVPQNTTEFMAKCSACGDFTNLLKGLKILQDTDAMYRRAARDADAGHHEAAMDIFLKILTMLESVIVPPFKDYYLCQQSIRNCMISLGNRFLNNS